MPGIVKMPFLSPTMKDGNLVKWCKQVGENIEVGDVIAEIDTDKATMEVESTHKGILAKILVPEGTHGVLVHTKIAIIKQKGDTDEDIEKLRNTSSSEEISENPPNVSSSDDDHFVRASPLAKRVAKEYGIDISEMAKGSGPGGRIVKADIPVPADSESFAYKKPTSFRRAMIDKLVRSSQEVPHFYMQATANVTDLMRALKTMRERDIADVKITMNEFVVKAVALAMKTHPNINVSWIDGDIRQHKDVDISVAVAVEEGIYAPVLRKADSKSIREITREIREFAERAKQNRLRVEEMSGGSLTISNLGMCEINSFYSIVNSPQASIISVARAMQSPIIAEDGTIQAGYSLALGYAVDHRVIDGLAAGRFLTSVKYLLENPVGLLVLT
jgi:pyruvate dehydrogenase E2 component (dihydrolipoamide acetyltransferase)